MEIGYKASPGIKQGEHGGWRFHQEDMRRIVGDNKPHFKL